MSQAGEGREQSHHSGTAAALPSITGQRAMETVPAAGADYGGRRAAAATCCRGREVAVTPSSRPDAAGFQMVPLCVCVTSVYLVLETAPPREPRWEALLVTDGGAGRRPAWVALRNTPARAPGEPAAH